MAHVSSDTGGLRVRAASTLESREIEWLWQGWLPIGKLALVDGDPGLGKSLLTLDLCARLSTGRSMPDGWPGPGPANSLILNAEDGAEDTVNRRLAAMEADRNRIYLVDCPHNDWSGPVRLPGQVAALERAIAQQQARFVVIDPVVAFLEAGIQVNSDQSVRRALGPLQQIATQHGCAVLLVRHLNKQNHGRARYRGGGTIGFQGACRATWLVERDPEESGGLVLAQVKNNLSALQGSLGFRVDQPGPDSDKSQVRTICWRGPSPWNADRLLSLAGKPAGGPSEVQRAGLLLKKLLESGPQSTPTIWEAGQEQGFSERVLRKAKDELGIKSRRAGFGSGHHAYWFFDGQLPPDDPILEEAGPDLSRWLDPVIKAYPPGNPLDEM
jgi:hypothetical protein